MPLPHLANPITNILSAVSLGVRALFVLFAVVVVGVSSGFMKHQHVGNVPATTSYSVFVGALGVITGILGIITLWIDSIPSLLPMVADGVSAIFFFAGGVAWAVAMEGQSCDFASLKKLYMNPLLNQGCLTDEGHGTPGNGPYCFVAGHQFDNSWPLENLWPSPLKGICQQAVSNEIFHFLGFVAAMILMFMGYLSMKRKGGSNAGFGF